MNKLQLLKTQLEFQPLYGWRYNPERVDMSKVLAPPYDVISPEKQQRLYERSPYNCIRLILNKKDSSDTDQNNSYTRARESFHEWQRDGILIREKELCFYVYRQNFQDPVTGERKNRYALLGRVGLQPFESEVIIPHEKTLRGPKEDRIKLLQTVQTNFSPVFGLYKDEGRQIFGIIQDPLNTHKLFEAEDEDHIIHTLGAISDEDIVSKIHGAFKGKKIYIADGHHRYETALEYARQKRSESRFSLNVKLPFDYMYMALVDFEDPGFIVLPTHRIVSKLSMDNETLLQQLGKYFKIEKAPIEELKKITASYDDDGRFFGLVLKDESYLLMLSDKEKAKQRMALGKPGVWYNLNVNVLGHLVFVQLLGLTEDRWESVLKFDHSVDGAVAAVREGGSQAAFLLRPPKVDMLEKMGAVRERMPQKSTYFYPKLATGLIFYSHKE